MKSFRAYLKQTKIFFIACVFMAAVSTAVICLYQLPLEAAVYLAVLWLGAGAAVFLYGYACYRQKVQNLILVEKAPEINLGRLGETTDEVELLYRDIIRKLDGMRMGAETERQRSLEEMTDYYTMWAHQIKTPIFALRLLIREEPEENRESLAQLFRIEQYVEMVLGYLRTEDMSADLKLTDARWIGSSGSRSINTQGSLCQKSFRYHMRGQMRSFLPMKNGLVLSLDRFFPMR